MLPLLLTLPTFVRPLRSTNHHGIAQRFYPVRAVADDQTPFVAEEQTARLLSPDETTTMLHDLQLNARTPLDTPPRGVFCTRSLDLKDIKCIGYDMDYTLIDYKMEVWEERAYHYSKEELQAKGFPVRGLVFNPELVFRGLIVDKENGNVLKVGPPLLHPSP